MLKKRNLPPKVIYMRNQTLLTMITIWIFLGSVTLCSSQGIGYKLVNYSPQSETVQNAEIPITPAVEAITLRIKNGLKPEIKSLKKRDPEYLSKRKALLQQSTMEIVSTMVDVLEVESLRVLDEVQALKSIYHFMDCWADKNFRSKKKDFCKGCWDNHIQKERLYQTMATVED